VIDGRCSFADLTKLSLSRFADLPADWRRERGWDEAAMGAASAQASG
jgi:sarcosine oxidase subunit beta